MVRASGLPSELGAQVLAVTGKCRLWREERVEVARELCAHFQDGLEAGASATDLAGAFGDPKHAAKLITATRKRLRPLWWRASRASLRAIGGLLLAMIVLYAILAARFFMYSPNVKRNITMELNASILRTGSDERAWPVYIEAKKRFGALPEFMMNSDTADPSRPGDPGWAEMVAWLDRHRDSVALVRQAAARPVMGYEYRAYIDSEFGKAMEISNPGYKHDSSLEDRQENPLLVGVLLPHLGEMRRFARWMRTDAHLAATRGDAETFIADIEAMLGIARQAMGEQFLISDLVGIAIADLAFRTVAREAAQPDLLSRDQLRGLAHLLAGFADGRIAVDAGTEVFMVDDILQRFFSDDGNGDGHFIGGPHTDSLYLDFGLARPVGLPLIKAIQPVQSVLISSRAEIRGKADRFFAAAVVDDALPPWRHHERKSDAAYIELMNSGLYAAVPFLNSIQESDRGPIQSACAARDIAETWRDVALTIIAMESARRVNGAWPASLNELVPSYLPRLPLDPFDGKPLRYIAPESESGRPVLYSVGVDCIDQQGLVPTTRAGRSNVHAFSIFKARKLQSPVTGAVQLDINASAGDWVLWPPLPPIVEAKLPDTNTDDVHVK